MHNSRSMDCYDPSRRTWSTRHATAYSLRQTSRSKNQAGHSQPKLQKTAVHL